VQIVGLLSSEDRRLGFATAEAEGWEGLESR